MDKLEKNRVFSEEAISELKSKSAKLMSQANTSTSIAKSQLSALLTIAGAIPVEARHAGLAQTASAQLKKMDTALFKTCSVEILKILKASCRSVYSNDTSQGKKISEVGTDVKSISKLAKSLQGLVGGAGVNGSNADFAEKLKKVTEGSALDKIILKDPRTAGAQYNNTYKGKNDANKHSKDPVNMCTGNFIYEKVDLTIGGIQPLSFKYFYNAIDKQAGSLGKGWLHNYEVHLRTDTENQLTLFLEDGREETFVQELDGIYRNGRSPGAMIQQITPDTEQDEVAFSYQTPGGYRYYFNKKGKNICQKDRNDNQILFSYNEKDLLTKAESEQGAAISYTYQTDGMLSEVCDHTGRTVHMEYREGVLRRVTDPAGKTITYMYNRNGKVSSITNQRGIVSVSNLYDKHGRTLKQKFPDGGVMLFEYQDADKQVILTERNGSKIIYVHDDQYRSTKTIYEDGEELIVYNAQNQKTEVIDKKGNSTKYEYDRNGNVTRIINALGNQLCRSYNEQNKVLSISLNGREKMKNNYDQKGNCITTTDALGRSSVFTYNKQGQVVSFTRADGSHLKFSYDTWGNIVEMSDDFGRKTKYQYDELNRVIKTTDGNNNKTSYTYDKNNNVSTVMNAEGNTQSYTYNEQGKVTSITDFDGSTIYREYNELNRPSKVTDQLGNITFYEYDKMWNVQKEILANGAETQYRYNQLNQLSCVTNPSGAELRYTYDPCGNCIQKQSANGTITRFAYDHLNRKTEIIEPDGTKIKLCYNEANQVEKVSIGKEHVLFYEYDQAGQKIKEINAMGHETLYTYTLLGKVESITNAAGGVLFYEYEEGGLLSAIRYPDGKLERYTYGGNQEITSKTGKDGYRLNYYYDSMNRIHTIESNHGQKKSYTYDPAGNITSMTEADGNRTCYSYNATGNLTAVQDALGNRAEYEYDVLGHLVSIKQLGKSDASIASDKELQEAKKLNTINYEARKTSYHRNTSGQITGMTDALGNEESYEYDAEGNLIKKTDKEGYETLYEYNIKGDMSKIAYADGKEVKLRYDSLRQLTEVEDWLGITRIELDILGRINHVLDYKGRKTAYEWGVLNERKSITYPDGKTVTYHYDEQMRLGELRDGDTLVQYAYNSNNLLTEKTYSNGIKTSYAYDTLGQLQELTHRDSDGILDQYKYSYDLMGNKTSIEKQRRNLVQENGSYEFSYDPLNRLKEITKDGQLLRNYGYDCFGNRVYKKEAKGKTYYQYNQINQLIHSESDDEIKDYAYDRRGNLVQVKKDKILFTAYEYGTANQVLKAMNQKGQQIEYQYNGFGNRIGERLGQGILPVNADLEIGKLRDLVNPEKEIEYILDGTKRYHNLLQKIENGVTQNFTWDHNLISADLNGKTKFHLQDDIGSSIRSVDQEGLLAGSYAYDEFGKLIFSEEKEFPLFGFTGYKIDPITENYFAQAREYNPDLGRFLSKDGGIYQNFTNTGSLNLYSYCANNPINLVDFQGHESIVVTGGQNSPEGKYQFVETALKDINDQKKAGVPASQITWVIVKSGYEDKDIEHFKDTAKQYGVEPVVVSTKNEFINYVNTKDKDGKSDTRNADKITNVSYYGHGESERYTSTNKENRVSFGYKAENSENVDLKQSDISKLKNSAFDHTMTVFFSCNAGTEDCNGKSFAQEWSNKTGGVSYGMKNGRTEYSFINSTGEVGFRWFFDFTAAPMDYINKGLSYFGMASSEWSEKQKRKDRDVNGKKYSEYGSLQYPRLTSLVGDFETILDGGVWERSWNTYEPEEESP